eukprot:8784554-Alexandrium_andersonii.AAC.1
MLTRALGEQGRWPRPPPHVWVGRQSEGNFPYELQLLHTARGRSCCSPECLPRTALRLLLRGAAGLRIQ